ncbi:TPA: coniferyl-alcohol dehydrogenase [Burkholderia cepacia ATCC 25416]|nr:coniferyl-alcohol dehydrogenase [Burkholderia cepacia ATCC 25416]HDV6371961.1 coniferyl-alcohol dehydrogenase [Burkholderia cepacia]
MAQHLAEHGVSIIALGRRVPDCPVAQFIELDISDPSSIEEAAKHVPSGLGGLCNIAGVAATQSSQMIARSNYLGLRLFTESLTSKIVRGGSIVNIGSSSGFAWSERKAQHVELGSTSGFDEGLRWLAQHPVSDAKAYGYFKEALIVWTMQRALSLRDAAGIRMNCVSPGPVETPILQQIRSVRGEDSMSDAIRRGGGIARPADIVPAIAFMLSAASHWMVGANLAIDGGLVASMTVE